MIITLTGQKGGSGKTTAALCIADELHRQGRRVLVVDIDPQASALAWSKAQAAAGVDGPTVTRMGHGFHAKIGELSARYDDIVIDCASGLSTLHRAALMLSDVALFPCGPGATDLWSMEESVKSLEPIKAARPELNAGILITRRLPEILPNTQTQAALDAAGLPILGAALGFRAEYQTALSRGLGVTRYAPQSDAAAEVCALVEELQRFNKQHRLHILQATGS